MFRTQNLCPGSKNVFDSMAKTFFVSEQQNLVSASHVSRAAKLGNICIRNKVSATMFPSLARPLSGAETHVQHERTWVWRGCTCNMHPRALSLARNFVKKKKQQTFTRCFYASYVLN